MNDLAVVRKSDTRAAPGPTGAAHPPACCAETDDKLVEL
jgi:hypothetical protein